MQIIRFRDSIAALSGIGVSVVMVYLLLCSNVAYGLNFTPTESEWRAWPDYCRARYVVSGAGKNTSFERRISKAEVNRQQMLLGSEAWYWLHHYCASLAYMSRAEAENEQGRRNFLLREAEENLMGHYERINTSNAMFPDVVVSIAKLESLKGNLKSAIRYLEMAFESHPLASSPYAFASLLYREAGDLESAISVLNRGNSVLNGSSAELHYFLGILYLEVDRLDMAEDHARLAYELGYPLPGLAAKLQRRGRLLRD